MAFVLSKLFWMFASPGSLLTLLLFAGVLLGSLRRPGLAKTGKGLIGAGAVLCVLLALLPLGEWALTPLENRFSFDPSANPYGIIVIGGDEKPDVSEARGQPIALDSMRRYMMTAELAKRYPGAKLVFAGGSPLVLGGSHRLESEIARDIMGRMDIPVQNLIVEKKSRNTHENAVFAAEIVRPEPRQKWLLVTSAWHMPRAMACFRAAGWNVAAAPTGYFTTGSYAMRSQYGFEGELTLLSFAMHEYVGLAAYKLLGWTNELWPT